MHEKRARTIDGLEPRIARWIERKFGEPTEVQVAAVGHVLQGRSVLISSPTGSGKTLAAFLGIFDYLARIRAGGKLPDGLWPSMSRPCGRWRMICRRTFPVPSPSFVLPMCGSACAPATRRKRNGPAQKRRPPHILLTTPESLAILLSQSSWLAALGTRRFLVVDEIHALAENKRGTHLMVSAERLQPCGPTFRFAASDSPPRWRRWKRWAPFSPARPSVRDRDGNLAEENDHRGLFAAAEGPLSAGGWTAGKTLKELAELLMSFRTTLIFTNTRSGAESIGLRLKQLMPKLAKRSKCTTPRSTGKSGSTWRTG